MRPICVVFSISSRKLFALWKRMTENDVACPNRRNAFETRISKGHVAFAQKSNPHRPRRFPATNSTTMPALVGSPIMAKAAKPTVRVNTTVRAAAAPE